MMKGQPHLWFAILISLLLLPAVVDAREVPTGGLRILSPPDGTTVEPGQPFTVVVEPDPGVTPTHVGLISPLIVALKEQPPFTFSVTFPPDAPLGPETMFASGLDAKERPLEAAITLHIETATPVTSIRVDPSTLFFATEEQVSVSGTFADGVTRSITRSREITYSSSNPQMATVTPDGLVEGVDPGTTTLTVTYKDKSVTVPVTVKFKKLTVPIDIKPDDPRNTINLDSEGHVSVAILSTSAFDATTVNARRVKFGPAGALPDLEHVKTHDVNRDGKDDLILRFQIQETGLQCGQTSATLTGVTVLGDRISGSDTIRVVGRACR